MRPVESRKLIRNFESFRSAYVNLQLHTPVLSRGLSLHAPHLCSNRDTANIALPPPPP